MVFALTVGQWAGVGIAFLLFSIFLALIVGALIGFADRQSDGAFERSYPVEDDWVWPEWKDAA